MGISDLIKPKAKRVIGIDPSTSSVAFAIVDNGKLVKHGKIIINGNDIYEKIYDARKKVAAMHDILKSDYIAVEAAVFVQSADVVIKLAYTYGAIISQLMQDGTKVVTVTPSQWQNYLGNPGFSKSEKENLKKDFPGKSATWYNAKAREIRKKRTMDFVNEKFGLDNPITDHDVSDAVGIAHYAYETLTAR